MSARAWCSSDCGSRSSTCTSRAANARRAARGRAGWCSCSRRSKPGRRRTRSSTYCSTSATGSSASASVHWATPRRCRSPPTSSSSATSSARISTRAAARSAASPRSTACSRRWISTRTTRWSRRACRRDADALSSGNRGTVPERGLSQQRFSGQTPTGSVPAIEGGSVSTAELVTVRIDERSVQVPKGTGLIETAAAAGIEIPVFCYEPRLGAAVGACRMCLVEVEGMPPKPQAGCTLTAQDGMVVKTARTSEMARVAQNATLEFILVNHPLDCPVCDKGGECPLQDLTFRYGPGSSRMTFQKRTWEKPIPISPTISIDRERCILCYRCTRFSENVSEDGELVAVNRGAQSMIATFDDEPYRGAFSGNVTELCPVGALLPTTYRFEARPWEITNVPTVCGMCPVGCNVNATVREGRVKRILSRNHPEIDEGWLCDKGRFAFTHLRAADRIVDPIKRVRRRGFEPVSWDEAIDEAARLLEAARGRVVVAFSGSETAEQAYALAKLAREGLDSHEAMLPEEVSGVL